MTTGPASHSRVRGLAIAALLVLVPPSAFAHDLWMVPGKYRLDTGETTRVFINDGDVFPGSLTLLGQQRITEVNFRGPDGENTITDFRVDGKSLTFDIASKVAGTYVLALGTHPRRVRMKADDFRDYLTEEKLDEITKMIEDRKETEQAAVERYAKWAKTVVDVGAQDEAKDGDDSWEEPMGQPFEIVPLRHPNRIAPGGELPIRVLFRGEPLPGVNVIGARASGPPREITTRTDEKGEATVTVSAPGRWYLRALHMIRLEDDPEMHWESFWCTLTFEVLPRAADGP
jgi:Domain of unknown function (DUF4198)